MHVVAFLIVAVIAGALLMGIVALDDPNDHLPPGGY